MRVASKWLDTRASLALATHETGVVELRDDLRDKLESSSADVSDVAKWEGDDCFGYAFMIKIGDHEFCVFMPQSESTDSAFRVDEWFHDGHGSSSHPVFYEYDGSGGGGWDNPDIAIGYNYADGSWGFGFDDLDELTFSGGDFEEPETSPFVDWSGFMPNSTTARIFQMNASFQGDDVDEWHCYTIVVDDQDESVSLLSLDSDRGPWVSDFFIAGNIIDPDDGSGDGIASGMFRLDVRATAEWSTIEDDEDQIVFFRDDNAEMMDGEFSFHREFTMRNGPVDSEGLFRWNRVGVREKDGGGDYYKGEIKPELMRVIGSNSTILDIGRVFNVGGGRAVIKVHESMAVPWVDDRLPFPHDEYDANVGENR